MHHCDGIGERKMGRDTMSCPQCGGEDCMQIEIHLQSENTVRFYACRRCESKWWEREGGTITLSEVLSLASRRP